MTAEIEFFPLGNLIVENQKSKLKVRDSSDKGEFLFFTSGAKTRRYDSYMCEGENLFLATGGSASVKFYSGKAAYSTDCYSVRAKDGVDAKYLYYFMRLNLPRINDEMFLGAALKHLQKKMLKEIVVPLPSLERQREVARLLEKTESIT